MSDPQHYAAIDLGSNSFHMIIAREDAGHLHILDRLRDNVRLASGLTDMGDIDADTEARALNTLAQFGQRLREFPSTHVRCVGTNTLRRVNPKSAFLERAQDALGHPIDIIAGREEARLIYLGTTHSHAPIDGKQLVIDIGGGSTELIIGEQDAPSTLTSLGMGCVTFTQQFFKDGVIDPQQYQAALTQAGRKLQPIAQAYKAEGWQGALGCSGTIKAIESMAVDNALCPAGISKEAIQALRMKLLGVSHISELDINGLSEDRRPVILGGFAVLDAIFNALNIDFLDVSQSALREGLLYDTIGRKQRGDVRDITVNRMMEQYNVSQAHAQRVQHTVNALFEQIADTWQLDSSHQQLLNWAAQLSEVGLSIAHSKYHRHSRYIIAKADMPGFSWNEQTLLSALLHVQRSRFNMDTLSELPQAIQPIALRLATLLRLAKIINRSRLAQPTPALTLTASNNDVQLALQSDWLAQNPLTEADLESEIQQHIKHNTGFTLTLTREQ